MKKNYKKDKLFQKKGQDELNLKSAASNVDTCIGKIRTISGVDPSFRRNFDRLARTAQLDEIDKILRSKVWGANDL